MNFKKIVAGAIASAVAVSALAISASANIYPISDDERDPSLLTDTGSWLIQLYNREGNEAERKPQTDRGLDVESINSLVFYTELLPYPDDEMGMELEMYDVTIDGFGGSVIYSANGGTLDGKYNWPMTQWWGLPEEGDSPEAEEAGTKQGTVAYNGFPTAMEYVNTFAYKLDFNIDELYGDDPEFKWPTGGDCYQVGLQEWGNDPTYGLKITLLILKDSDDNFIMGFNEFGEEISETEVNEKIEWLKTREINLAAGPGEDPYDMGGGDEPSDSEEPSEPEDNGSDNASDDGDSTTTTTTTTSVSYEASGDNTMLFIIIGIAAAVVIIVVVIIVIVKKKKS